MATAVSTCCSSKAPAPVHPRASEANSRLHTAQANSSSVAGKTGLLDVQKLLWTKKVGRGWEENKSVNLTNTGVLTINLKTVIFLPL